MQFSKIEVHNARTGAQIVNVNLSTSPLALMAVININVASTHVLTIGTILEYANVVWYSEIDYTLTVTDNGNRYMVQYGIYTIYLYID